MHAGPGRGNKTGSDTTGLRDERGAEYVVARLKRDDPELAERVLDGELTPHVAAIRAGIRKQRITVQVGSPRLVANQLRKYMTPDQIAQLIALLLPDGLDPRDPSISG